MATVPKSVVQHLDQLGVAPALRELVTAAGAQRHLTSALVAEDYVSLSPAAGGSIAAFVHRNLVSVALPTPKAEQLGAESGWTFAFDNATTSHLRIPAATLASTEQRALGLTVLVEALDRRSLGSRHLATPPSGEPTLVNAASPAVCPIHYTQMLGGECELCD
ncbi:MAG: hypothetical protein JWP61_348 [Friedmanniella sp.]|nr:hypothetical protein [Friedmanniella sp.]